MTNPLSIPLNTPEGLYPLTAIKDLTLQVSVDRGVEILDNALFGPTGLIAQGKSVAVLGYSQSAVISSL
ncbi:PE-PPE domain-containing protein, partial [Mycobacterium kansasii]